MISTSKSVERQGPGALFILPSIPSPTAGPASTWIPAAGWAEAVEICGGRAWLLTPLGILTAAEALSLATSRRHKPSTTLTRRKLPVVLGTLKRDMRNVLRAVHSRNWGIEGPWRDAELKFVWQRHELFVRAGLRAARHHGCPFILFVDAPVVWESEQWGVKRPGWGRFIERIGEKPALRQADLVCCISDRVAEQACSLGAKRDKVLVTPNATDLDHFQPGLDSASLRQELGLTDRVIVGWVGSFRRFHGLDRILDAYADLEKSGLNVGLLLIGDGYEKDRIVDRSHSLGLQNVRFTGIVPYEELPRYIRAIDIALLTDSGHSGFHYSPLKLQEYMACGKAVIASAVGQVRETTSDGIDCVWIESGEGPALKDAIESLYHDPSFRTELGRNARTKVEGRGGWQRVLDEVENHL